MRPDEGILEIKWRGRAVDFRFTGNRRHATRFFLVASDWHAKRFFDATHRSFNLRVRKTKTDCVRIRYTIEGRPAGSSCSDWCVLALRRAAGRGFSTAAVSGFAALGGRHGGSFAPAQSKSRHTSRTVALFTGRWPAANPLSSALSQITLIVRGMPRERS